ncbi:hypothetical protein HanIR_Chr14g0716241 [Helianthus annuus]|nr:hypothetical protein HanIR_Chr14g0716241 [Helianthus annuus]
MALPCQTLARLCQAFRQRHSQPALASSNNTIKIQGSTTVPGQFQLLISSFPRSTQLLPSTIGSHDQTIPEHGRATSGTFERDFSENGSIVGQHSRK